MKKTLSALSLVLLVSCSATHSALPVSQAEQAALTPDAVIQDLMDGNARYQNGQLQSPNVKARIAASSTGQYPKAVILSCLDSRVPVEDVFDQGIGDIFVGRVAGNVENVDQIGSMEFAAKLSGVKVVMVLGHSSCGAVKGACDGAELGNLTTLLSKIKPAIAAVPGHEGERNSKNADFVAEVVEANVRQTVADIRAQSAVLSEMERAGEIKIVGGIYSLETGAVELLN